MSDKKEQDKRIDQSEFWRGFWRITHRSHRLFYVALVWIGFSELAGLITPYIVKLIIDRLANFKPEEVMILVWLAIIMFFGEQLSSFVFYFKDKIIFRIMTELNYYLPLEAHRKLLELPLSYHEKENTGGKMAKIDRGVWSITDLTNNISWEVAPTIIKFFVTLGVLIFVDYRLALTFLFFSPLFVYMTYQRNKKLSPLRKERQETYEKNSSKAVQAVIGINTVKSFSQEKREISEYGQMKKKTRRLEFIDYFLMLKLGLWRNLIIDLGRTAMLFLGIYLAYHGQISVGTLIFVISLSEKAYFSLYRLSRFYDQVQRSSEAVNRLVGLLDEDPEIKDKESGLRPREIKGEIEFKNLSFAYGDNDKKALYKINLKIHPGQVTALVGPSGGGKTTLARMIYRHYDPQKGEVLLDGRNVKDYNIRSFRRHIAIVPQEVDIFDLSVRNNISYGRSKASLEEVKKVARIANAEEFIEKLPDKYDTMVGERGVKLSGGQRQRLGIARAILADPRIVIFDEATSNLDSQSERLIQDSMEKIIKGRTAIIIAHRLSTIKRADKIVVLEDGRVVEEGTHAELANTRGGLYAKLLKLQEVGDVS